MLNDGLLHAKTVLIVESIILIFWKNKLYKYLLRELEVLFCFVFGGGDSRF